jgi:hypothetical protein
VPAYIEEVFSTWLFSGNNSSQTIVNNIDLSTNGGLVWIKPRNITDTSNTLYDTARGVNKQLSSESDGAESTTTGTLTAFNTNGFSIGTSENASTSGSNNVSWTWRKQPKFFDVVTWTGSGANRTIAHNLGSVPGCIIVKRRNTFKDWQVYHRSLANTEYLVLNSSAAKATGTTRWNSTTPTSTVFSLGTDSSVNASGDTYVAYLFAHDAGGFGLTGTDNVISCGTFTAGTGSVNLGYEPQWIMFKGITGSNEWIMFDTMRGWPTEPPNKLLMAEYSSAEGDTFVQCQPTATGFNYSFSPDCIYIAIRRGPMKVPTSGTSVFAPVTLSSSGTLTSTANFPIDLIFYGSKSATDKWYWFDRLRGTGTLQSNSTAAEDGPYPTNFASNVNFQQTGITGDFSSYISYDLRRAPSFFDEVCYTGGTGTPRVLNHNLTTPPELVITKIRNFAGEDWVVHYNNGSSIIGGYLNNTTAFANSSTAPSTDITSLTSTTYTLNTSNRRVNGAYNYVAYLFATCAGVSKVGSYTGNGSSQTINCGFTGGARFVLVKATSTTGNWIVADSARGIVAGNDPALYLNSTAAEVTGLDWIDADNSGFVVNETATIAANTNGVSYIFLAIA